MLWINEGGVLDDARNLITTRYIDLRDKDNRTVIPALVKECKREHALEDGETVLISKPARFREYGEVLIRDEQEGFAKEESTVTDSGTPNGEVPSRLPPWQEEPGQIRILAMFHARRKRFLRVSNSRNNNIGPRIVSATPTPVTKPHSSFSFNRRRLSSRYPPLAVRKRKA